MDSVQTYSSLLKNKKFWYLTIMISFSLFSCKKQSAAVTSYNRFINSSIQLSVISIEDSSQNISIDIKGDGSSRLSGGKNSIKPGNYKTIIPAKSITYLFNKLECSNFFDFHNEYGNESKITPQNSFLFHHRGFSKKILVYSDLPEELKEIKKMIEKIILYPGNEYNWIEIKD